MDTLYSLYLVEKARVLKYSSVEINRIVELLGYVTQSRDTIMFKLRFLYVLLTFELRESKILRNMGIFSSYSKEEKENSGSV